MSHLTSISVRERMGVAPNYRNSANDLFRGISCGMSMVVLDFAGVEFVSRGFADQFFKACRAFQEKCGAQVVVENTCSEVQHILQAVIETQNDVDRTPLNIPITRVRDVAELERRLLMC